MMTYAYQGNELDQFFTGATDMIMGPKRGRISHRVAERWRREIPDSSFVWNELCAAGTHLEMDISAPITLVTAEYAQYPMNHAFSIRVFENAWQRYIKVPIQSVGRYMTPQKDDNHKGDEYVLKPASTTVTHIDTGPLGSAHVVVMLPHTCVTEVISVASDAKVVPTRTETHGLRWTHYGSSISQGMQVDEPARRWPEQVVHRLKLQLKDFSLSGNAQLDTAIAHNIAEVPADIISCAIGINIVNSDSMRERTFVPALHGFLDAVRERQPLTPILMVSACACPIQEKVPGPTFMDGRGMFISARRNIDNDIGALTLRRTRELVKRVVQERHDAHLIYIDGRTIFGPADVSTLDDNLHPNSVGINRIAIRMSSVLSKVLTDERLRSRTSGVENTISL